MNTKLQGSDDLLSTIQLQSKQIQQLTESNRHWLESSQQQNAQIELLSRQLTDAHRQLRQQQQQQQQQHDSAAGLSLPVALSASSSSSGAGYSFAATSCKVPQPDDDSGSRVAQLEAELSSLRQQLSESERRRQTADEETERSRQSYDSEIKWLKTQLDVFEQDFQTERREKQQAAAELARVQMELTAAQRQLHQHSLQQMQDLSQRREAALDYYRREYERTHPASSSLQPQQQQQQRGRPVYQSDSGSSSFSHDPTHHLELNSDDEGEDEID